VCDHRQSALAHDVLTFFTQTARMSCRIEACNSTHYWGMVLDARHFLRDVLFNEVSIGPELYWHRPIVITGMSARLGDVIGLITNIPMKQMTHQAA